MIIFKSVTHQKRKFDSGSTNLDVIGYDIRMVVVIACIRFTMTFNKPDKRQMSCSHTMTNADGTASSGY